VPQSGSYTVATSCTFGSSVNGVDDGGASGSGGITINSGITLTINASETVAWAPGSSITNNGTIAKSASGAVLQKGHIWTVDSDGDGYSTDLVYTVNASSPGGTYVRRYILNSTSITDTNDSNNACYRNRYSTTVTSCVEPTVTCVANEAGYQDTAPFFTVFVTSTTTDGNLGGTSGADTDCQALADAESGISGSYTAWVSASAQTEPEDRGLSSCGTADSTSVAWYLPDDTTKVADDWADLTDGTLDSVINQTESGGGPSTIFAWTNVKTNGKNSTNNDCANWTSAATSKSGVKGSTSSTTTAWTNNGTIICDAAHVLYCFQHAQ